jgi:Tfp pilus assembly PilM family ATPase
MSLLASWLASPPPDAAVEITPGRVSAATMIVRRARPAIQSFAVEALPENAIHAALTSPNVVDRAAVAAALSAVVSRLGSRPARVALLIPDVAARVSVLRFEQVPAKRDDLDQLVRWQMRKAAPFPIDDASVSYTAGLRGADGSGEFIVVLARTDVIKGYEDVCGDLGLHAGLVDVASFAVVNLALATARSTEGDWLVVHIAWPGRALRGSCSEGGAARPSNCDRTSRNDSVSPWNRLIPQRRHRCPIVLPPHPRFSTCFRR